MGHLSFMSCIHHTVELIMSVQSLSITDHFIVSLIILLKEYRKCIKVKHSKEEIK